MNTRLELIQADITTLNVDAIVNAANNALMGGGGVDGAIHRAAGPELKDACRLLMGCETGMSKMTPGYKLPARYVIHTVGPVWNNGTNNEEILLASCYQTALQLAAKQHLSTIAFPSISTGAYRFPFDKAAKIAWCTIAAFLEENAFPEKVVLVFYNEKDKRQFERALASVR
jgi:O-acetyl-ADP-ribose deacetylase